MGAIKDVVFLATQLSESVQDRRFASDLFKIIQLVNTIQCDQASLTEKNIELMSEKSELKQSISALKSDITRLHQQISNLKKQIGNIHPDTTETFHNLPPFVKCGPFMYSDDDKDPYCTYCWQAHQKRLQYPPPSQSGVGPVYKCPGCKNEIIHPRSEPKISSGMQA